MSVLSSDNFILRAKEVHGEIYDYSKTKYINAKTKMIITCKMHGDFLQKSNNHIKGQGCPKCGIRKCSKNITTSFEEFLERAKKKHGEKFQYIKGTYNGLTSKMTIVCPVHGNIEMTGQSHCVSLHGCSKCGDISAGLKKIIPKDKFIETCKLIHENKYSYEYVEYKTTNDRIKIVCPKHGIYTQVATKHYRGAGCRKCADNYTADIRRKTTEQFIAESKAIWGGKYDYSLVDYKHGNLKVKIICSIHGIFEKIAREHILNNQGCQYCVSKRYSKLGTYWLNYMKISHSMNIQFNGNPENDGEYRIANSFYHADGYCKESNTIFEFHGSYWHGDPNIYSPDRVNKHNGKTFGELYQNTLKKMEHCKENGYNVIECWESAWVKGIKAVKRIQKLFRLNNKK